VRRRASTVVLAILFFVFARTGVAGQQVSKPATPAYRVSEEVLPTDLIGSFPDAPYTEAARKAGVKGTVRLSALVGTDGCANDIRVLKGLGYGLDESAVETVKRWHWRTERINFPKANDGTQPVRLTGIEINFDPHWSKVEPQTSKPCAAYPQNPRKCDYVVKQISLENPTGLTPEQRIGLEKLLVGRCFERGDPSTLSEAVYDQLRRWDYKQPTVIDPDKDHDIRVLDDSLHPSPVAVTIDFRLSGSDFKK
jgi:TonB family protein